MLPSQRHLFEVPRDVAYFNNGSFTPLPLQVRAAGEAGVAAKSTPWLMDEGAIKQRAEAVRAAAAGFIGATADDIAIINSAAYGVATAAANLPMPAGTRVLIIEGEFPSQSLEWARRAQLAGAVLDVVPRPAHGDWTTALLDAIARPGAPPISIAALTPLDWTTGSLIDLEQLAAPLRSQGAAIVVDATHAAGLLALDVKRLGADFLVFPTYKWLLGPYTLAFLYVAPHRQTGTPLEQYGYNHTAGPEPFSGQRSELIPTARRFDMGERYNPVSLPMGLAGMELLHGWGREAVAVRLRWLTDQLAEAATAKGFTPVPRHLRPPHVLGLRPPAGMDANAVVAALSMAQVHVAARGGAIRVTPHVFNDEDDVERFATAL